PDCPRMALVWLHSTDKQDIRRSARVLRHCWQVEHLAPELFRQVKGSQYPADPRIAARCDELLAVISRGSHDEQIWEARDSLCRLDTNFTRPGVGQGIGGEEVGGRDVVIAQYNSIPGVKEYLFPTRPTSRVVIDQYVVWRIPDLRGSLINRVSNRRAS